jgi:putative transposase
MPRLPRLHITNGHYYVTLRGNHRRELFSRDADRRLLETFVADAAQRTGVRVHAYCWMPDHIQLLVQIGDMPLGRFMQRIGTRYARAMQRQLATTGHFFESRYDALLIDVERYFLRLVREIHLSPLRVGIAATPEQYRWSSHQVYLGRRLQPWVHTDFGLSLFHWEPNASRESFAQYVAEMMYAPEDSQLRVASRSDRRVLGDAAFLSSLQTPLVRTAPATTLDKITQELCRDYGVTRRQLRSVRQNRLLSRVRGLITVRALEMRVASLSEIGRYLNRSPSALTRVADRYDK